LVAGRANSGIVCIDISLDLLISSGVQVAGINLGVCRNESDDDSSSGFDSSDVERLDEGRG
jgi:hypothetical protein